MSTLRRFEELLENVVEGSLGEVARGHLHPVEIAKELAKAMESGHTFSANKVLVPNDYAVFLNPEDDAVFAPFRASLERELASYLAQTAEERGYSFVAPPSVGVQSEPSVRRRRMRVTSRLIDTRKETRTGTRQGAGRGAAPAQAGSEEQTEFTARLPTAEVRAALLAPARLILPDGRVLALDKPVFNLGRGLDNDIVLEDRRVSRHHAQIRFVHNAFLVYDLQSSNGTTVNGYPGDQTVLRHGDRISLGGLELVFQTGKEGEIAGAR